jgi:transcriptional antiterminator RfaH
MKAWYLLYCKPRNEVRAQQNLAQQGIETYLPMMPEHKTSPGGKANSRQVPLFPSYLFIHFDPLQTSVARIHATRGVNRLIGCREDMTPIDDDIIRRIKLRELKPPEIKTEPSLKAGDKIRFTQGPFAELEGVFEEPSGDKRCHVLFNIMGQLQRLTVPRESIVASRKS